MKEEPWHDSVHYRADGSVWVEHPHTMLCSKKGEHLRSECLWHEHERRRQRVPPWRGGNSEH